jgi:hypothetical protein
MCYPKLIHRQANKSWLRSHERELTRALAFLAELTLWTVVVLIAATVLALGQDHSWESPCLCLTAI